MPETRTNQTSMNIERLKSRMGKYTLVVAVAQRARDLKDRQGRLSEVNAANLVGRALTDISDARVKILPEEDEE